MRKNGSTIEFDYNADGLRISKTVNGVETRYEYVNGRLTEVRRGNDTLHIYYDAQGAAALTWNQTAYYYLRNMQGDITGIVNASGTKVVEYTYDAWGNILSVSGSLAATLGRINPLRYRGYVYDEETGLYYLTSRYYEPSNARWLNGDHLVSTGRGLFGQNCFQYCYNNPVNTADELGNDAIWLQEETNVFGAGHSGVMVQDENGIWFLYYWGPSFLIAPDYHEYRRNSFGQDSFRGDNGGYLVHIDPKDYDLHTREGVKNALKDYTGILESSVHERARAITQTYYYEGDFSSAISDMQDNIVFKNYNLLNYNCFQTTYMAIMSSLHLDFDRAWLRSLEGIIPNSGAKKALIQLKNFSPYRQTTR